MKDIIVVNSEAALTKEKIKLLEQKLGAELPIEYKDFLLIHNGGHPEKDHYSFFKNDDSSNIAWFLAFYEGEYENLLNEFSRFKNRMPKGFIPIARDSSNSRICLCVDNSEYGKVYFWDFYQEVPLGDEPTFVNMHLIANNFTDFINGLYKLVDIIRDNEGKEVWVYAHDKYSLPFSIESKKYGSIVTAFFAKAPAEVEDYLIEEAEETKDLLLWYEVKSESKKYFRKITADGQVEDYQRGY